MSWNFSQCFYYRPPVLNIFQSKTPKFHCLQWINNAVLSLKYHALFNQALSVKQRPLERYFLMIRTIRNLAAITKNCSQSHTITYIYSIRVSETQPDPWGWLHACSCNQSYVLWLAHISLEKTEAKACMNCRHKETETKWLLLHKLKVLAKL